MKTSRFLIYTLAVAMMASCGKTDKGQEVIDSLVAHMVSVEGGTFTMGATEEHKTDVANDEKPLHEVTLANFSIGRYEVTQAEWVAVMGQNPSKVQADNLPVTNVSWDDCQQFLQKLNEMTGRKFRLPTEAEWEYAARGGKLSKGTQYSGEQDRPKNVGWFVDNSNGETHPVGEKTPNELGLYDMSGNVWEWCEDKVGYYSSNAITNPKFLESGSSERIMRGGSWKYDAKDCRVSYRGNYYPSSRRDDNGVRLVMNPTN